jgi:hypothetical protein
MTILTAPACRKKRPGLSLFQVHIGVQRLGALGHLAVRVGICLQDRNGYGATITAPKRRRHMQLHPYAADGANAFAAFAEVDLRMARRMGQRHEDLARPAAGDPAISGLTF